MAEAVGVRDGGWVRVGRLVAVAVLVGWLITVAFAGDAVNVGSDVIGKGEVTVGGAEAVLDGRGETETAVSREPVSTSELFDLPGV